MAWSTIFANLTSGNQPLALFDAMFNQVAQMVAVPCTAAGTNSLTLTPIGNAPSFTAYQNFTAARFVAANTSTATITAQFGALANLPVYLADGITQAAAGAIVAGQEYVLVFVQALNAGGGGFFLESAAAPAITPSIGSALTNLQIINGSPTTSTLNVSYDELVMNNPAGGGVRATGQSFTINAGVVGVNGIDVGSLVANTWYYVWGISNGATAAGLLSLQSLNPTMPGGYTYKKRLGAVRTDGSANLYNFLQRQRWTHYDLQFSGNTTSYRVIASGIASVGPVSIGAFVPPTAINIRLRAATSNGTIQVGPNSVTDGQNFFQIITGASPQFSEIPFDMLVESGNISYGSTTANSSLAVVGWEDNL